MLETPSWMTSLDIQDAYLHVPIRPSLHKFLALTCQDQLYFFKALPFGLATAPLVFTNIMKFPLQLMRLNKINLLAYLDDLIVWDNSQSAVSKATTMVISTLERLGFLLNLQKSHLTPTQSLKWLGVQWDSAKGSCAITKELQEEISFLSKEILTQNHCTRRGLEKLMGKIAFAAQISAEAKLKAHRVAKPQLLPVAERDSAVPLPESLRKALLLWVNPKFLSVPSPLRPPPANLTIWTDASAKGWGAYNSRGQTCSGVWNHSDLQLHINCKELKAILLALSHWAQKDNSIIIKTDNAVAAGVIKRKGSRSDSLQSIMEDIFSLTKTLNLSIIPSYIPGRINVAADALSRTGTVPSEWSLPSNEFERLQTLHGKILEVDLFASPLNHKLPAFVTPFPCPQAIGYDAFSLDWNDWSQIYLFPPRNLLGKVCLRLKSYHGEGLLIAPFLPRADWFPHLVRKSHLLKVFDLPEQKV